MPLSSVLDGLTLTRKRVGRVRLHTGHCKLKLKVEQPQQGLLRHVKLYDGCVCTHEGLSLCYKHINRKGQNHDFADNFMFYV